MSTRKNMNSKFIHESLMNSNLEVLITVIESMKKTVPVVRADLVGPQPKRFVSIYQLRLVKLSLKMHW